MSCTLIAVVKIDNLDLLGEPSSASTVLTEKLRWVLAKCELERVDVGVFHVFSRTKTIDAVRTAIARTFAVDGLGAEPQAATIVIGNTRDMLVRFSVHSPMEDS